MRYDRVQAILEHEPALKDSLGPKDQEIIKRNKEKHFYSRGVVTVTAALHDRGFDAHNADRSTVLHVAAEVLGALKDKPAKPPTVKPVVPKPVPKPAPAPKAEVKLKPTRPKPKPKAKPEPVTATPVAENPPAVKSSAPALSTATANGAPTDDRVPVYYIYATGLSLVLGLRKILEMDQSPGFEARQQKVDDLYSEMYKLRDVAIPIPADMMPPSLNAKSSAEHSKG